MIVDINVTPLVDVTLVLLIIFMVTATYIVSPSIKVDLPKAASGSDQAKTTLAVTLAKDRSLYLNGERSSDAAVGEVHQRLAARQPGSAGVIAADTVVPHGDVVQ